MTIENLTSSSVSVSDRLQITSNVITNCFYIVCLFDFMLPLN